MTVDEHIKTLLHWNVHAWHTMLYYMETIRTNEGRFLAQICQAGLLQNNRLLDSIGHLAFIPAMIREPVEEVAVPSGPEEEGRRKDIEELERMFGLEYGTKANGSTGDWYERVFGKRQLHEGSGAEGTPSTEEGTGEAG